MKVIAFAASSSSTSINKRFATAVANQFQNANIEVLDLNDFGCPMFSEDKEKEIGQAQGAIDFVNALSNADVIVASFAEHNGNYAAVFKNLFDWCSRIERKMFFNKPTILLSTSPGGRGGATVLDIATQSLPRFGAELVASISLPSFNENFDTESGQVTNEDTLKQIQDAVNKAESLHQNA